MGRRWRLGLDGYFLDSAAMSCKESSVLDFLRCESMQRDQEKSAKAFSFAASAVHSVAVTSPRFAVPCSPPLPAGADVEFLVTGKKDFLSFPSYGAPLANPLEELSDERSA
jgi:hypothetical protein